MKSITIEEHFYNLKVQVFIGEMDEAKFNEQMLKLDPNFDVSTFTLPEQGVQGTTWDCGHNQVIWVGDHTPQMIVALLAHELVHAAFHSADRIGHRDHYKSQEFHGYYCGWAMEEILNHLKVDFR